MNKAFKILEIIWLVLGFVGICMSGYFIVMKDNQGAIYFIIFTVVSGLMYAVRRRQRMKYAENQNKLGK